MTALLNLLVVEDNDIDVERIMRCLDKAELPNPLHFALDGEEALDWLRGENGKEAIDSPCLILLDLNMPRMNGLEFLEELRKEPDLADTPVLVLTTSDRQEDIERSCSLGAIDYVTKPITREQLAKIVVYLDARQHATVVDERTYTAVVVDDAELVRDMAITSAMGTGWSVSTFACGTESLEHVSIRTPDVLIVDKEICSTGGVDMLQQFLASDGSNETRLFLASDSPITTRDAERADELGASIVGKDVMSDPVSFRDFLESANA